MTNNEIWAYIEGIVTGIELPFLVYATYLLIKTIKEKRAKRKEYIEQLEKENRELKSKLEAGDDERKDN